MSLNWFLEQISNINIPTVLLSLCGSWGLREFVDWIKNRNLQTQQGEVQKYLQSQKAEIDRQLEVTKKECQREIQTHYLQTQLKTSSLYKAYPELHWALKETEGSVYQLFYHSWPQKDTHRIWCELTKKLAEHSLFLDNALCDACVVAKDLLLQGIRDHASMNDNAKDKLIADIHGKIEVVTNIMRRRLLEDDVDLPHLMPEAGSRAEEPALL